jgi:hypothetical protein
MAMTSFWQIDPPEEVQYANSGKPTSFSKREKTAWVWRTKLRAVVGAAERMAEPFLGASLARRRAMGEVMMSFLADPVKLVKNHGGGPKSHAEFTIVCSLAEL